MLRAAFVASALAAAFAGLNSCSKTQPTRPDTTYALETVVNCGAGGDFKRFVRGGWAQAEPSFTWTQRTDANLKLSLPPIKGPLALRMRLTGNLQPRGAPVQVDVSANGHLVARWLVDAADDFHAIIPSTAVRPDGKLLVGLHIPRAQLPASPPDEQRRFGVACYELEVSKAASVPPSLDASLPTRLPPSAPPGLAALLSHHSRR